jgi:hypothetical protein
MQRLFEENLDLNSNHNIPSISLLKTLISKELRSSFLAKISKPYYPLVAVINHKL